MARGGLAYRRRAALGAGEVLELVHILDGVLILGDEASGFYPEPELGCCPPSGSGGDTAIMHAA